MTYNSKNKVCLLAGLLSTSLFISGFNSQAWAKKHHDDTQETQTKDSSGSSLDDVINGLVSKITGNTAEKAPAAKDKETKSQQPVSEGAAERGDIPPEGTASYNSGGLPQGVATPVLHKQDSMEGRSIAVVRVLDRITSQTVLLEIPIGQSEHFGRLTVEAEKCLQRPSDLPYDSAQYLKLQEASVPEAVNSISGKVEKKTDLPISSTTKPEVSSSYAGWFLAREPGATAYPSALFDVHAVRCKGNPVAPFLEPLPAPQVPNISSVSAAQAPRGSGHSNATQLIPEDMQDEGDQIQYNDENRDREVLLPPMPSRE